MLHRSSAHLPTLLPGAGAFYLKVALLPYKMLNGWELGPTSMGVSVPLITLAISSYRAVSEIFILVASPARRSRLGRSARRGGSQELHFFLAPAWRVEG